MKATGTSQTNGTSEPVWREDCGYNKSLEHEVIWQQGNYPGPDEEWSLVGIPIPVLSDINNNAKGKYGWHFDVIPNTQIC